MRNALAILALLCLLLGACGRDEPAAPAEPAPTADTVAGTEPGIDPVSGLRMTGDWQIVRSACTACHSGKQITQQRGTADQWLSMIRWMQEKQNLWQFDPVTEEKIINYLAANYPPSRSQRRAQLSGDLLPPNPYSQ
jgi:cytochrome c5